MSNLHKNVSDNHQGLMTRRDFMSAGVALFVGASVLKLAESEVESMETEFDMTHGYNNLNTNFASFFYMASRDTTANWRQEGDKKILDYRNYTLSIESDKMYLIIQDNKGKDMYIHYTVQSGKFLVNREKVDWHTIQKIDTVMGDLQKLFQ